MPSRARSLRPFLFSLLLLVPLRAHAALDEVLVRSAPEVTTTRVDGHDLVVRTRGVLKEYAGADGKVFAAIWRGARVDLHVLLGTHYAGYESAVRAAPRRSLHHAVVVTPELSVNMVA